MEYDMVPTFTEVNPFVNATKESSNHENQFKDEHWSVMVDDPELPTPIMNLPFTTQPDIDLLTDSNL